MKKTTYNPGKRRQLLRRAAEGADIAQAVSREADFEITASAGGDPN